MHPLCFEEEFSLHKMRILKDGWSSLFQEIRTFLHLHAESKSLDNDKKGYAHRWGIPLSTSSIFKKPRSALIHALPSSNPRNRMQPHLDRVSSLRCRLSSNETGHGIFYTCLLESEPSTSQSGLPRLKPAMSVSFCTSPAQEGG